LKRIALVLCALAALAGGAVAFAQSVPNAARGATAEAVGTAQAVDETALAFEDRPATIPGASSAPGSATLTYFLRMVFVLALVLCAIYLVVRFLRRLGRAPAGGESSIKVLASAALGAGRSLHVVSLGSKAYLLGSAEGSVSLIAEVEDREYLDALALRASQGPQAGRPAFAELLGSMLGGKGRRGEGRGPEAGPGARGDFLAGQRERLRKFQDRL